MDHFSSQEERPKRDDFTNDNTANQSSPQAYDTWTTDTEFFLNYQKHHGSKLATLPFIGRFFRKDEPHRSPPSPLIEVYRGDQWNTHGFLGWLSTAENRVHKLGTITMLIMAAVLIYLLFLTQRASRDPQARQPATQN